MPSEPNWLTPEHLIELNRLVVASTQEPFAVLKPAELESASQRPYNMWAYDEEDNVACLAVRLLMAVAQDHPFAQGNKRTGFIAASIFLDSNGWLLDVPDYEEIAEMIEAAVEDPGLEPLLTELFESRIIRTA